MSVDKIEVEIFIDDRKADAVLRENKTKFDKFADGVGDKLGVSMSAGLAGIAAGATAAWAAAGTALATLIKNASDYGSVINDASQKTGLAAESVAALKFNAEAAGSSLDQVTAGIAKFAKSQPALTDLDKALDDVFKKIAAAKPGVDQLTKAQEAFGRSGGDLIPVILQAGGSFEKMKTEAERLGLTIGGPAAKAADDFGDSLGTISAQAENAAARFTLEFLPQITSGLNSVSELLANNKDVWTDWGKHVGNVLTGVNALLPDIPGQQGASFSLGDATSALIRQAISRLPGGGFALGATDLLGLTGQFVDGGTSADIQKMAAQIEKNKQLLERAKGTTPGAPGSTIKGTGLAFTDDEKWREGNKKYFAEFQAGIKAANEAEKKYAADRKKMIDDSIKAAKEWAQYVGNAGKTISETFASTTDNPFSRIWSDSDKAIDKVIESTYRLKSGLTDTLVELIRNKTAAQEFGQSLSNALKANSLRTEAANIGGESVEAEARRRTWMIYSSPEAREAAFQSNLTLVAQQRQQNELQEQLRIINQGRSPSESAEISRRRDQEIIAATQGLTGSELGGFKSDAINARLNEAKALDNEKQEAKALKEREIKALEALEKAISSGAVVRVVNEAPDKAKVNSQPTKATSNKFFTTDTFEYYSDGYW